MGSPPLVQCRTDKMSKRLGLDLPFLLDGIHIHPKPKPVPAVRRVSPTQMRNRGRARGTRVLTGSGCRSQGPPYQGTRAPLRGIPGMGHRVPRELGGRRRVPRSNEHERPWALALAHLFKVGRDCESLVPETEVRGDCDAVLAHHGHHTPSVVFHDRLARDTVSQAKQQGVYSAVVCTMMGKSCKFVRDDGRGRVQVTRGL